MPYPTLGFRYIQGQSELRRSAVSSTATFLAGNPVTLSDDRTLIEADSDSTAIFGIAENDAADTLPGTQSGLILVRVPYPDTVFALPVQTDAASSILSIGQSYNIEKSGNHFRLDTDSQGTSMVTIVPRGDGSTIDSADSSVYVQFLGDRLGVFNSQASVVIFAQD